MCARALPLTGGCELQGAKVADSAFIDTLDVMDLEHLEVGENAVIGEGTTIVCHTFQDGNIIYNTVTPCLNE